MGINNEVYDEWGENKNSLLYFHYWIGNEENEAQAYNDKYGVKMPTVTWDMFGSGENLKLGAAMTQQTTNGTWRGGTHYILTPDYEIINLGEDGSLRSYLEEDAKVPKGESVAVQESVRLQRKGGLFSSGNSYRFTVAESGIYHYSLFSLKGQILFEGTPVHLSFGEDLAIDYQSFAVQPVIVQITTPMGFVSKTLIPNH